MSGTRSAARALAAVMAAVALFGPSARATPLACANPCTVQTYAVGYVAPVVEIRSGTRVVWTTGEESHPTSDSTASTRCFLVAVGSGVTPTPVLFDIVHGSIQATTAPGTSAEVSQPCRNATPLPDGSFELPFRCLLHPWMNGELLIHV